LEHGVVHQVLSTADIIGGIFGGTTKNCIDVSIIIVDIYLICSIPVPAKSLFPIEVKKADGYVLKCPDLRR